MAVYEEFHNSEYTRLRRSLIRKSAKGSPAQREFLAAGPGERQVPDVHQRCRRGTGGSCTPTAGRADVGGRVREPAVGYGAASVRDVGRFDAQNRVSNGVLGDFVTYRHIEERRIESSFLAANGGGNVSGAQRIDAALSAPARGGNAAAGPMCPNGAQAARGSCRKPAETVPCTSTARWHGRGGGNGWSRKR